MDERQNEEMLRELTRLLNEQDEVELPPEILSLMREADRTLREEQSLFSAVRKRLHDLSEEGSGPVVKPSFAFEGEDEEAEDPISEVLRGEEE